MTRACLCLLALTALAALGVTPVEAAEDNPILAGPMPGHSAMRAASIWLQTRESGQVVLEYWPTADPRAVQRTPPQSVSAQSDHTARFDIGGITPGRTYAYRVLFNGRAAAVPGALQFRTQPLWQHRSEPPDFKVALGSCAFINDPPFDRPGAPWGGRYEIFSAIAAQRPDMMLWLGDNLYFREADYDSPSGMAARYRQARSTPVLQELLRATHHYAIWDDHDYGPNDANQSFVFKEQSLELFKRYWANPGYGLPGAPGIYTQVSFHDVDFFLLDDRYYRSADIAPDGPDKHMLGVQQLAWLKGALLGSRATFKIIANGSQMLNDHNRFESWHHFPAERADFLHWLHAAGIGGVVFLSGDRHHTELLKIERPGNYPLYELTCSPLTGGVHDMRGEADKPALVGGTLVGERNFCRLDVSGPRKERLLTVRAFDADGKELWRHEIPVKTLKPRR